MSSSINGMRIAGLVLAVATCCGVPNATRSIRAYVGPSVGGPGFGNAPAPGSAGLGTAGLGLGGFGSATQNLGLGDTGTGSSQGLSLPLLNQGSGNALGVTATPAYGPGFAFIRHRPPIVASQLRHQFADGSRQQRRLPGNKVAARVRPASEAAERQWRGRFVERPWPGGGLQGQSCEKSLNRFGLPNLSGDNRIDGRTSLQGHGRISGTSMEVCEGTRIGGHCSLHRMRRVVCPSRPPRLPGPVTEANPSRCADGLEDHCRPTDIYQEHMSGSAKSQQYCQRPKQACSRKGGSWASGRRVPDRLGLTA